MKYNFKLVKQRAIPEIKGEAIEMLHKSGAKLLYIKNNDEEKAFSITFRTPPKDSTGVFHILEHSVLCGSKKFPVKEPFTNLLKTSMQTFLNAFTFDDKTMYPVASTNEKDLMNLVDVYMDAVLNPKLHDDINIFYQEGGHPTPDGGFNGVVYNEMSGALSDPQEMLSEYLKQNLFPDTHYRFNSGGEPKSIKKLTYDGYKQEHKDHYQLSNAYIIVYGDLNINNMLEFLDTNYLNIKTEGIPREIQTQKPVNNGFKQYEMFTAKENATAGCAYVTKRDHFTNLATDILINALTATNESPLKEELLKSNIAADYDVLFYNGINQPTVFVTAKTVKENKAKELDKLISKSIENITLTEAQLYAAIAKREFSLKENIAECSPGIDAAVNIMSEWLYDDDASMTALSYEGDIKKLKELAKTDYFNELAKEIFVNNKHKAHVEIVPTENKTEENLIPNEEAKELCKILEQKQNTKDSPEDIAKLPKMTINDIAKIKQYPKAEVKDNIRRYNFEDNGITYAYRYYDLSMLKIDELPYASLLSELLGKLDTTNFNAQKLDTLTRTYLGSLSFTCITFNDEDPKPKLAVRATALHENVHKLASLVDEIIFNTKFIDTNKINAIITQQKVALEQNFINAGHMAAINRAMSYISPAYKLNDILGNVDYYKFLKTDINIDKFKSVTEKIFSTKPDISIVTNDECYKTYTNLIRVENKEYTKNLKIPTCENLNEAFIIPSNVSYASIASKTKEYNGSYAVASNSISLEYLWDEVRVKNGAYGAGMLITTKGNMSYYSFRDPKLDSTYKSFCKSGEWLYNHNFRDEELEGYIISNVAKIDAPKPTRQILTLLDNNYYNEIPHSFRETQRNQIINTTIEDIKKTSKDIDASTNIGVKCVFGGEDIVKDANMNTVSLFC